MEAPWRTRKRSATTAECTSVPDAPTADPVFCGKRYQASVTEAWGYWGPDGDGYAEVCQECVAAWRAGSE